MQILKQVGGLAIVCAAAFMLMKDSTLEAQSSKLAIGYTDPDVIIAAMPEFRTAQQTLQQAYQQSQQAVQTLSVEYQQKLERYQQQQAMLSQERRTEREGELMKLQQDIQTMATRQEQQLKEREVDLMNPIQDKVMQALNEVAATRGLDLVIRAPGLLYANEKTVVDLTEDLAVKLGLPVTDSE